MTSSSGRAADALRAAVVVARQCGARWVLGRTEKRAAAISSCTSASTAGPSSDTPSSEHDLKPECVGFKPAALREAALACFAAALTSASRLSLSCLACVLLSRA